MTKLEFQAESVRIKNIIVILKNIMVRNHNNIIISIGGECVTRRLSILWWCVTVPIQQQTKVMLKTSKYRLAALAIAKSLTKAECLY